MLRKSAVILAVVICLANGTALRAEPGRVVAWLMKEPISLFDLGMLQLNLDLKMEILRDKKEGGNSDINAEYKWDDNRIEIAVVLYDYYNPYIKYTGDPKEVCKDIIGALRQHGQIDPDSGHYSEAIRNSSYSDYFSHYGYVSKNAPDNYRGRLDKIIEFSVLVQPRLEGGDVVFARCTGPLLSNKVYFGTRRD